MVINFDGGENGTKLIREYKHFLESVIRDNGIWILFEDGRVAIVETEEGTCVPLWSTPEGAEANREGDWVKFEVQKMTPAEFVTLCIPDLEEGNIDAIVEMKDGTGIHKNLLALEEDLYEEADNQSVDLDEMCMEFEDFLDANEMYEDFIEDALEEGLLWILTDENGETVFADVEEETAIPVWTLYEEASLMCEGEWQDCEPEEIPLTDFLEYWVPMLEREGINVMFSVDDLGGMGTPARIIAEDLRRGMETSGHKFDNVIQFPMK